MVQPAMPIPPRGYKDEALLRSVEELRHVLAGEVSGRQCQWAEEVGQALARVEQGLRQHLTRAQSPDGPLAEIDGTRPSLVRQAGELCQEQGDLLEQCQALQKEVQWAASAFSSSADSFAQTAVVPKGNGAGGVPDFGTLRERLERFADAVQKAKEMEASLVLESVTTDLGAGD